MKRNQRIAALAAVAILAAATGRAQAPKGAALLANSVGWLSAPDLGKTWENLSATPIYAAIDSLLQTPAVQNDPDWQGFQRAKAELEAQVGFSISPKDILGAVVKGFAISVALPAADQPRGPALIELQLNDPQKFQKLFAFLEQKARTETGGPAERVAEPYGQTEIVTLGSNRPQSAYAAQVGSLFAVSNDKSILQQAIDGKGPALGTAPLASKALEQLKGGPFDLQMFVDFDSILKGSEAFVAANPPARALLGIFQGVQCMAAHVAVSPSEISFESASLIDPAAQSPVARIARTAPGELKGLAYVPQQAWLVSAANNLDLGLLLESARSLVEASGDPQKIADFKSFLVRGDQNLGLSIEKDLIPAIGSNMVLALNKLAPNLIAPQASELDLTLGIEVRNEATIRGLLAKLEQRLQAQMAAQTGGAAAGAAAAGQTPELFLSEERQGAQIRYAKLPMLPNWTPGYVFDGGMLLFAPRVESLRAAIDCKRGAAASSAGSEELKTLSKRFGHAEANKVSLVRVGAIVEKVKEIALPFIQLGSAGGPNPDLQAFTTLLDGLGAVRELAVSTRWNGQALHTGGLIALGPASR